MQQMMRLCRRSIPLHRSSQTVFISESQKVLKKSRLYFFQIDQKYLSNVSKESSQSIGEQNDEKSEYESTKSNKGVLSRAFRIIVNFIGIHNSFL